MDFKTIMIFIVTVLNVPYGLGQKDTLCFDEYHGVDLNGTFMKDIPDAVRSIPYYWELSPEQLEEHLDKIKKHNDNGSGNSLYHSEIGVQY